MKPLNPRIPRNLRSNFPRWFSMLLLIAVCTYVIISLMGFSDVIYTNADKYYDNCRVEDGEFSTFAELSDSTLENINALGFETEKNFYTEYPVFDDAKLRVFKVREKIDLININTGNLPEKSDEILLEQGFADAHNLKSGDILTLCGQDLKICGTGCTPDYEMVLMSLTDSSQNSRAFGTAFVTEECRQKLIKTGKSLCSEEYLYSYKKINPDTDDDILKDYICDLEFDETQVENEFFLEMIDKVLSDKIELENAVDDLSDVCSELTEVSEDFNDGAKRLLDSTIDFCDGIKELTDGVSELSDGAKKLTDNSDDLIKGADKVFEFFLSSAQSELEKSGISAKLTKNNYKTTLKSLDFSVLSYEAVQKINEISASLESVDSFCNGLNDYTNGVTNAAASSPELSQAATLLSDAASQLKNFTDNSSQATTDSPSAMILTGISQNLNDLNNGMSNMKNGIDTLSAGLGALSSNSNDLRSGASQIFDYLLTAASDSLNEYGIECSLSRETYREQLYYTANEISSQLSIKASDQIKELTSSIESYEKFYNGLKEYINGVSELKKGIDKINNACSDVSELSTKLKESAEKFCEYASELKTNSYALNDNVKDFQDSMDSIDEYFELDIDNLTMFIKSSKNTRVQLIKTIADRNRSEGVICGSIILILLSYIITIFTSQEINEESAVIGALYSMGIRRKELVAHYISIPLIIAFLGGVIGTATGYSKIGIDFQINDVQGFYSLPKQIKSFNPIVILCGIFIPVIIAFIVTSMSVRGRLSASPLSLLRKEQKKQRIKKVSFEKLGFINDFRLKHIINESKTSFAVFFGMFLPMILVILAVNFFVSLSKLTDDVKNDVKYNYMYTFKYTPENIPENSYEAYVAGMTGYFLGTDIDVNLIGINDDNPFFDYHSSDKNTVAIGTGTARKFGFKPGDIITLYDSENTRYYTFKISDIVEYNLGLGIFMNIDDMREIFDKDDDFYNVLYSEKELDIENGRLYSVTTKDDTNTMIKNFGDSLSSVVYIMTVGAVLIYSVVTFLMIKLMIDRASVNISMMKIFGFHKNEINRLYMDGNFITIAVSALISVPGAKIFVDKIWFPVMNIDISYGFDARYNPLTYVIFFISIFVLYFVVSTILKMKINAVSMTEVLKNRE